MRETKLTIIMYHYIRDLKKSQYPRIKGLDIHLFKEQLEYCAEIGRRRVGKECRSRWSPYH